MVGIDGVTIPEVQRVSDKRIDSIVPLMCPALLHHELPLTHATESVTALTAMRSALVLLTCAVCEMLTGAGAGVLEPEQAVTRNAAITEKRRINHSVTGYE